MKFQARFYHNYMSMFETLLLFIGAAKLGIIP